MKYGGDNDRGSNVAHILAVNPDPETTYMKASLIPAVLLLPVLLHAQTPAAEGSTGPLGDSFSLQGALDIFSRSKDLGSFERALNDPKEHVNNLDLNNDGNVDYIRVVDHKEGDSHAIILEDPVDGTGSQDVAVIEVEKTGANTAQARVVGDESLYGPGVSYEKTTVKEAGPSAVVVDVWAWPSVRYVYGPSYVAWNSPWVWGSYPRYYHPWHPYPVSVYYGYTSPYRPYYRSARNVPYRQADVIYVSHRRSTPTVVQRPRPANGEPRSQERAQPSSGNAGQKTSITAKPGPDKISSTTLKEQPKAQKESRSTRRATRKAARAQKHGGK